MPGPPAQAGGPRVDADQSPRKADARAAGPLPDVRPDLPRNPGPDSQERSAALSSSTFMSATLPPPARADVNPVQRLRDRATSTTTARRAPGSHRLRTAGVLLAEWTRRLRWG